MKTSSHRPVVAVAGDVCIDWLSIPIEPARLVQMEDGTPQPNWRLRGGEHMLAVRGGAWLTADLAEAALANVADVIKPGRRDGLENVSPDEIIHSLLRLRGFRTSAKDASLRWRVAKFEGFAGPLPGAATSLTIPGMERTKLVPDLVLLDDAGNGFRDHAAAWPAVLTDTRAHPLVIYKCRRPLTSGKLWECVKAKHAERTVIVLTADDLRASGATISLGLSWERTAFETWLALAATDAFHELRTCAWIVVSFGIEGALLIRTENGNVGVAKLWFSPRLSEGDLVRGSDGDMTGFGSAFAAALSASLIGDPLSARSLSMESLSTAVKKGMLAARRMLATGFGPTTDGSNPHFPAGQEAARGIFSGEEIPDFHLAQVRLPALKAGLSPKEVEKQRLWRILDQIRGEPMAVLASKALIHGQELAFADLPCGVFGKFVTVDRAEIESYRSVRNLMLEYVRVPSPERPLCLAVFGQPGSGKSFGVTQVALDVAAAAKDTVIEKIEFNVSQWDSPAQLVQALHRVRDFAIRGKVPLVFFDEFDSALQGADLAWLKSFLAPMQDGVFSDGQFNYQIGRAIFVFAGGTAHRFGDFVREQAENTEAKAPDFLSRLRGHVDVFGFRTPTDTNLIRRALVLRVALKRKFPGLFDSGEKLRIEPAVVTAFLHALEYRHGARSIEAIVEMSRLVGFKQFESSSLPPEFQLDEHTDAAAFLRTLARPPLPPEKMEAVARKIHAHYLAAQQIPKNPKARRPAQCPWDDLDPVFQNSNREQAADFASKLAVIGCEIAVSKPGDEPFQFIKNKTTDELELLAEKEHERWMSERRPHQPDHPAMKPWAKLPAKEKKKDRDAILNIPSILASVGLSIRRVV